MSIREASRRAPVADAAMRIRRLSALEKLLTENRAAFIEAVNGDFGHRSRHETELLELFPSLGALRHARRHVRAWMKPERRPVSISFQPARAEVRPQPLGVIGIVVPWNYPIYLTVGPLAGALAAGNRAMVKLSEHAPATSHLFATLAPRYFAADELAIVEGDAAVARAFTELPFDHLLFTGSTGVGRHVMRAAAENLTPVTLELGGKSPVIIAPDYPLKHAAERIIFGKCVNAGQTCIAPDYVLLPAGCEREFIDHCRAAVRAAYPDLAHTPDYTSIINSRHFERLSALLAEAEAQGAKLAPLSDTPPDPARRLFPPVAVLDGAPEMRVMREELFGPILPIVPYRNIDGALDYVVQRDRPLALYLFDRDTARIEKVLNTTVSGGVTVNDTLFHIAQEALPFGGVGPAGMGHYHGYEGFLTFSKLKPVFRQARFNGLGMMNPPFGARVERLLRLLLR